MSSRAARVSPTGRYHKTQTWQERVTSVSELQPQGLIGSLFTSCSETLQLLIRYLDSTQITKGERNSLKRCSRSLFLWSEGHGATTGALDASLDRCKSLRLTTLAVLNPMCTLLAQGLKKYVLRQNMEQAAELVFSNAIRLYSQTRCLLEYVDENDSDQSSECSSSSDDDATNEIQDLVRCIKLYTNSLIDLSSALVYPALEPVPDDGTTIVRLEQHQAHHKSADKMSTNKVPPGSSDNVSGSSIRPSKDIGTGPPYEDEIKCPCDFQIPDQTMIRCEACDTWQHFACSYTSAWSVPDVHKCLDCSHTSARTLGRSTAQLQSPASGALMSFVQSPQVFEGSDGISDPAATVSASPALLVNRGIEATHKYPPCNTLYIGDLPIHTTEIDLKELFATQRGYKRLCFRTKQDMIMCFVEFEDTSFATQAMERLQGRKLKLSTSEGLRISYSKGPLGVRSTTYAESTRPQASVQSSGIPASFANYQSCFASDTLLELATWAPSSSAYAQTRSREYGGIPAAVVVHGGGTPAIEDPNRNVEARDMGYFK